PARSRPVPRSSSTLRSLTRRTLPRPRRPSKPVGISLTHASPQREAFLLEDSRLVGGRAKRSCADATAVFASRPRMDTNLYLVGFMGTGKSTVGRLVARQIGFEFVDSDHEIERLQGKPVSQIFAEQGETAFRAMEREFIERGHP